MSILNPAAAKDGRAPVPSGGGRGAGRGFRPEVQGLRALAVLMVVSYHIWFGRVSGGVDVFLLLSAFLLSLSFLRKIESGKPLDLLGHWLHQFRRLLPAVVVVIVGVLAASLLLVPRSRWLDIIEQSWASLFYVQNWVLASNAVDYYAEDDSLASPLQHFWSLSVQGQVFILWPLLFLASAVIARRYRLKFRGVVLIVFGSVFVASLAFSVWETSTNQAHAYFDTRTRLWEFAFGTLLALALPLIRLPRFLRVVAGWAGLALMLSGGILLDVQGQFPGYIALWPLTAAALVIIAGQTGSRFGADRILSSRPLTGMGDLSYALYLWHWPVLVLALIWQDRASPGLVGGILVIGVSLVLAYVTMRLVERPLRGWTWADRKRRRAVVVLAVCVALVATPLTAWQQVLRIDAERITAEAARNNPGARALEPDFVDQADSTAPLAPDLALIPSEWPIFADGCDTDTASAVSLCTNGATDGSFDVVILGSSHAQMWATPLLTIADEEGWKVTSLTRGYCPLTVDAAADAACVEHNEAAIADILERRPDAVMTNSTQTLFNGSEALDPSWEGIVRQFTEAGIDVLAIRDTPRMATNVPDCIETTSAPYDACGRPRAGTLQDETLPAGFADGQTGLHLMDLSAFFCPDDFCPAVIGNVIVYKDSDHATATYLRTLTPQFRDMLPGSWF